MVVEVLRKLLCRKIDSTGFLLEGNEVDVALPSSVDLLGGGDVSHFIVPDKDAASGSVEFQFSFVSYIVFTQVRFQERKGHSSKYSSNFFRSILGEAQI